MSLLATTIAAVGSPLVNHIGGVGGVTLPRYLFSTVGLIANDELIITMSKLLDSGEIPATTAFVVNNGAANAVTNVAIATNKVTLTLTNEVEVGDTVTVAYTKPGAANLQDTSANEADSWTAASVINLRSDQYITYENSLVTTPAETIYTDGTISVRKRITGTAYIIDVTLTATGFAGVEDTDWTWVSKINGTTAVFRSGVRAGDFVVDGTLNGTGFAGVEDTDWENHSTASGGGALTTYRDGVRDEAYVIDKVLTATGFAGSEDTDWENIRTYKPI